MRQLLRGMLPVLLMACHDQTAANREACKYSAGDPATTTLADYTSIGSKIPIDHIVLVMQENRSFDHYYSSLTVPGQAVDGASPDATNPDPAHPGGTVSRFHQPAYCFDNPAETWDDEHRNLDDGKLDGFTTQNAEAHDPSGRRAMGYYDGSDLPFYDWLARTFTISDRHFCAVLGPTFPNRLYYMAGTSFGVIDDSLPPATDPKGNPYPNLFTRLNDAHVSWMVYSQDVPTIAMLTQTWVENTAHLAGQADFFAAAKAGTLPSVSFVEGSDRQGGVSPDEDPPADPQPGEAMVAGIVQAVVSSPNWSRTALFLSYDENGGFYDHVPPPSACVPDDIPPNIPDGGFQATFDQDGFRVPLIVVSPYAKRGYVSHQVTDHTSVLRFVEARFGLPALTNRDANATPPFDMFDFDHPDLDVPAPPDAPIDQSRESMCASAYPPSGGVF